MSPVFKKAITHRVELQQIIRQDGDLAFINCLEEIRQGMCNKSETFMQRLSRPLSREKDENAIHIFFRRLPMQVFNVDKILTMPGEMLSFEARDTGITRGMKCPADEVLLLKPGCKVMLLWNKSSKLKNGTAGVFVGEEGETLVVDFKASGERKHLPRETWEKRSRTGAVIGTRTQFPITLMYGITCHKSQGLTLPAAIIHCSKEFVPGLTYVALTRVKNSSDIQVINFSASQLLPPSQECLDVSECHHCPDDYGTRCCRSVQLSEEEMYINEGFNDAEVFEDDGHHIGEDVDEGLVKGYFDRGESAGLQAIDLETLCLFLMAEGEEVLKIPPPSYNVIDILEKMKVPDSVVAESGVGTGNNKK